MSRQTLCRVRQRSATRALGLPTPGSVLPADYLPAPGRSRERRAVVDSRHRFVGWQPCPRDIILAGAASAFDQRWSLITGSCPKCGGSALRQITPGFSECVSPVVAGVIQRPGDGGPMPAEYPCGHRFQTGTSPGTEPCWCGRDSIGSCADCARRLCGLHGTSTGLFLCGDCFQRCVVREKAEAGEKQAIAARERAAEESRCAAVNASLRAALDPDEIMTLICVNEAILKSGWCHDAWMRLVASGVIKPTHDIVKVEWKRRGPCEVNRVGAWRACEVTMTGGTPSDYVLRHDGRLLTASSQWPFNPPHYVLPRGEKFRTARDRPSGKVSVVAGVDGPLGFPETHDAYARVAAAVLRAL